METQKTDKDRIRELEDQISEASLYVDFARCIIEDISQGYFNHTDATATENVYKLIYNYDDCSQKSNIVSDYLHRAQSALEELQDKQ